MNAMHRGNRPAEFELTRFDRGIIRRKVSQIIGRNGFTYQDRESLEQELIRRLLHSFASFDKTRAHRNVFVTTVVERDVAKILRDCRAEKRDRRRVSSLNVLIPQGQEGRVEVGATIGMEEYDARRCQETRTNQEFAELKQDLADLLNQLPDDLRHLAEQLKQKSLSQIAREMGVPRTTLRERLNELRKRFEAADMRFHL